MKIALVTGFLGAGKTSWINHYLETNQKEKLGVVINDFGTENIDAQLLHPHGIMMEEVSNGSIFCSCVKDKFIDAMIMMAQKPLDWILVEASGLADPSNMGWIIDLIRDQVKRKISYEGAICIVDALYFMDQVELLPVLKRQIEHSGVVVVNKIDLIDELEKKRVGEEILSANPQVFITHSIRGLCECGNPLDYLKSSEKPPELSLNTESSRPVQVNLKPKRLIHLDHLQEDMQFLLTDAYRIKGFVDTASGPYYVDCVGNEIKIEPWDNPRHGNQIVVLSSIGVSILMKASQLNNNYTIAIQR